MGKKQNKKARKKFPPVLFSCLRFLNSADPIISEPETAKDILNDN